MQGKRIYPDEAGHLLFGDTGIYGKDGDGNWWACPPATGFPVGRLGDHQITEHDDGTITVSPSILVTGHYGKLWHGYLEKGEWREV